MRSLVVILMGLVLSLGVLFATGCVSPETAAKYEAAVQELNAAKGEIDLLRKEIESLAAKYKSGQLAANEVLPAIELLKLRLAEATERGKEAAAKVKEYAKAPDAWWDKLGYVLLSVLGVAVGRKLGLPGLAHGTQPLPMLVRKDE